MKPLMSYESIQSILADTNPETTEQLAQEAAAVTRQYFGRTISLYAPIYLSNYCSSFCTYCGFNNRQKINRAKLSLPEIRNEMRQISQTGIENILLLTGESYTMTPLSYLQEAVEAAKEYFTGISLEVHPMETEEYRTLYRQGADGVTVYQETYNRERYQKVHLGGKKTNYDYRLQTPERIARAGMRSISLGILLGLGDTAEDLLALFHHLRSLEKSHPAVEYSLSFPRLRQIKGQDFVPQTVDDITFTKIICLSRICFPRVGINLSTREPARLRDHLMECGVTRISAGSRTSVGGYTLTEAPGQDPQFDIQDNRSVEDILTMLKQHGFDPVFTDWRPIPNA
ncbi:MAG TPA: 2-iminoacetate synthase ThiH [Candidatus Omnitrophota bacterium]|nr:2-iminoacetate synthase ThiH [Candidatus Omnitrophota bacterium]HQO57764.1 2-iminoacetate synthase ThiH [Candidatus Omnitrophota bacterium]HQP11278.1 2-iminoacetate synthase ThiH [Candidatus Omnitrophota bacterium]